MGEFDLIARYFTPDTYSSSVLLGVGDDAAVLDVPTGHRLVSAVDTLVAGVHFPLDTAAADIAYRALAVNLSDMAAMGAQPRWFTLSLCMPQADEIWLAGFAASLHDCARCYRVELVGGDTVKGPLNISIQMLGMVESDVWLTRAGAHPGDVIFVSGVPGEAAGGLQLLLDAACLAVPVHRQHLLARFHQPTPRVELGRSIRRLASAAMDISDGLLADLRKLCMASHCGAHIDLESLPASSALRDTFGAAAAEQHALHGGDDYELLFTVAPDKLLQLENAIAGLPVRCTPIGRVIHGAEVHCCRQGVPVVVPGAGFDHFANNGRSDAL